MHLFECSILHTYGTITNYKYFEFFNYHLKLESLMVHSNSRLLFSCTTWKQTVQKIKKQRDILYNFDWIYKNCPYSYILYFEKYHFETMKQIWFSCATL